MPTIFEALADPTRRRILDRLRECERSVGELAEQLGMSQPGVSKHLRVLRDAGLVEVRQDAQRHWYQLRADALQEIESWMEPYRRLWSQRLDALEKHLNKEKEVMDGTMRAVSGGHELRFERNFKHPVEKVWAALTRPEELEAWLARAEIDLTPGGRVELRWLNGDSVARGRVTALEPPRLLEYNTDIHGRLRWELTPEGDGCRLVFTCTLAASAENRLKSLAGWHIHLDHLEGALEGRRVDWPRWWEEHGGRWTEYHERYAAIEGEHH